MKISSTLLKSAQEAKQATQKMRLLTTQDKNQALLAIADSLEEKKETILQENEKDIALAKSNQLSSSFIDRLSLHGNRLIEICHHIREVVALEDPLGEILEERTLKNGIVLKKQRVPIGVLGVIYEARPNVTVEIATLAIKTGNGVILRGGKETRQTNAALIKVMKEALKKSSVPDTLVQWIRSPSYGQMKQLMQLDQYVDMIIPRGGAKLQKFCVENSIIPVITGGVGICHIYVGATADLDKAVQVIDNAKRQRPAACNAVDTVLIHHAIAAPFLEKLCNCLPMVHFKVDKKVSKLAPHLPLAEEADWHQEWLGLTLGLKIVESVEEAVAHIQTYGSNHSEGVLTEDPREAAFFVNALDAAALFVNCSTRFNDGGQMGLGAEVAISTQKLHARGPMGLKELTSYKWILQGNYQVRA